MATNKAVDKEVDKEVDISKVEVSLRTILRRNTLLYPINEHVYAVLYVSLSKTK